MREEGGADSGSQGRTRTHGEIERERERPADKSCCLIVKQRFVLLDVESSGGFWAGHP